MFHFPTQSIDFFFSRNYQHQNRGTLDNQFNMCHWWTCTHHYFHLVSLRMCGAIPQLCHIHLFTWMKLMFMFCAPVCKMLKTIKIHEIIFCHTLLDTLHPLSCRYVTISLTTRYFQRNVWWCPRTDVYLWPSQWLSYSIYHVCPLMHLLPPPVLGQFRASF